MLHRLVCCLQFTLIGLACSTALMNAPARGELIAHWTFDEPGGQTAHDQQGSFHGTLSGTAELVPGEGIRGGGLRMNRTDESYVSMGDVLPMTGQAEFSIQAWVKTVPGDLSNLWIVGKHKSGSTNGYAMFVNGINELEYDATKAGFYDSSSNSFGSPQPGVFFSATPVNDGQWHQIVAVYRAGGIADILVDGNWESSSGAWTIQANNAPLLIGGLTYGNPAGSFAGWIDEVQIYDHALSEDEVAYLYANPGFALVPEPSGSALLAINAALCLIAGRRTRTGTSQLVTKRRRQEPAAGSVSTR